MFNLIFKYRTTVSPCLDIVMNWDLFHFTPTKAAWAEPCSCTEMILNLLEKTLKSFVTDIIKRLFIKLFFTNENYTAAGALWFPTAKQAWDHLEPSVEFLIIFRANGARVQLLVLSCCLHFYGVLCLTKLFSCMRESEENRSMLWNDKRQCCEIYCHALNTVFMEGRSSSGVII